MMNLELLENKKTPVKKPRIFCGPDNQADYPSRLEYKFNNIFELYKQ
jgi:hypothetical protein